MRKLKLITQIRKINRIQRRKVKEIHECNKQMRFVEKKIEYIHHSSRKTMQQNKLYDNKIDYIVVQWFSED